MIEFLIVMKVVIGFAVGILAAFLVSGAALYMGMYHQKKRM